VERPGIKSGFFICTVGLKFVIAATPKFAAQSIRKAFEIGWKPMAFLSNVAVWAMQFTRFNGQSCESFGELQSGNQPGDVGLTHGLSCESGDFVMKIAGSRP